MLQIVMTRTINTNKCFCIGVREDAANYRGPNCNTSWCLNSVRNSAKAGALKSQPSSEGIYYPQREKYICKVSKIAHIEGMG